MVLGHIGRLAQHEGLRYADVLDLVRRAIGNDSIPLELRRSSLWVVGAILEGQENSRLAFAFLTEQIKSAREERVRNGAAYVLRNFLKLDKAQRAEVRALAGLVDDEEVRRVLLEAVEASEQREDPPQESGAGAAGDPWARGPGRGRDPGTLMGRQSGERLARGTWMVTATSAL